MCWRAMPDPAPPGGGHLLGTDEAGRDMVARLLYGFRISVLFGLALTVVGTALGLAIGAVQGYFGGRIDLFTQRVIEIWSSIPELYLLIIIASIFEPSLLLLLGVLALFGWMNLSDYVRAEFLRNRNLEFVRAARAMGLSNWQIMRRHILPNSMTPVITFLPFRMSAAILALTSLDFLGLGVPGLPSLGELLREGKENLDAWWIAVPTFVVLVLDLAAAHLHRRRLARRVRHAEVLTMPSSADMTTPLLALDQFCARFGADRVVDRVSFSIGIGEKFGLVGESGSGKSVTALSILRLTEGASFEGHIRFEGEDLLSRSERQLRGLRGKDIAMIFQEPMTALNPLYGVGNQIAEVLELHEGLRPNQARAKAVELLARTGISEPSGARKPSRTSSPAGSVSAR